MIFVVEGINGVGKTALCNMLSEKTGIPVFREEVNFKYWIERTDCDVVRNMMVEKMRSILNILKAMDSDIIFDRFHLSEYVYGMIDRMSWLTDGLREIDNMLVEMKAKVIIVHPLDIESLSLEYGKDLREYEQRYKRAEFGFTKCNVTSCTYLEIEQIANMFASLYKRRKVHFI